MSLDDDQTPEPEAPQEATDAIDLRIETLSGDIPIDADQPEMDLGESEDQVDGDEGDEQDEAA